MKKRYEERRRNKVMAYN